MIVLCIAIFIIGLCDGVMCCALCKSADAGDKLTKPIRPEDLNGGTK